MAVKLRLKRFGMRGKPTYRLVALEEGKKRQGREIEMLGNYNPLTDPPSINFNTKRISYWLTTGAQCSHTVSQLLKKLKTVKKTR